MNWDNPLAVALVVCSPSLVFGFTYAMLAFFAPRPPARAGIPVARVLPRGGRR